MVHRCANRSKIILTDLSSFNDLFFFTECSRFCRIDLISVAKCTINCNEVTEYFFLE